MRYLEACQTNQFGNHKPLIFVSATKWVPILVVV